MGGSKAHMLKTEPLALTKSTRHSSAKSTVLTLAEVAKGGCFSFFEVVDELSSSLSLTIEALIGFPQF